jgi:hypothetical protein
MQLDEADRHRCEVCHHVVFAEERAHSAQQFRSIGVPASDHLVKGVLGMIIPMPSVLECFDLCLRAVAAEETQEIPVLQHPA